MATKQLHQFQLIQAQNGGWLVYLPGPMGVIPEVVAAYSNAPDALAGLARLMTSDPAP